MTDEKCIPSDFQEFQHEAGAELSLAKRALKRYLFPKNIEKSIRRHERFGTPIVKNAVMNTVGRLVGEADNYSLRKTNLESALSFATGGSVFNESMHTISAGVIGVFAISIRADALTKPAVDIITDPSLAHFGEFMGRPAAFALNVGLVAVQRYNRARVAHVADRAFKNRHYPEDSYRNWLNLDGMTARRFKIEKQPRPFDWEIDAPEIALPKDQPPLFNWEIDAPEIAQPRLRLLINNESESAS